MTLDQFQNATFASNHNNNTAIPNKKMCLLKFYLIGNVKGNFQILRRSVYDSSYYMLWNCGPNVWKDNHNTGYSGHEEARMNSDEWTISDLKLVVLSQNQKDSSGVIFSSVEARSFLLVSLIPASCVLPPLLHLLLGLRNDTHSTFQNFINIRI